MNRWNYFNYFHLSIELFQYKTRYNSHKQDRTEYTFLRTFLIAFVFRIHGRIGCPILRHTLYMYIKQQIISPSLAKRNVIFYQDNAYPYTGVISQSTIYYLSNVICQIYILIADSHLFWELKKFLREEILVKRDYYYLLLVLFTIRDMLYTIN